MTPSTLFAARGDQGNGAPLAVAADDDPAIVHVVAAGQPPHSRDHVIGVIGQSGRVGTAATLSDAALVVAQHDEAIVGQRFRQLGEDRDSYDSFVAICRSGPADEHYAGRAKTSGDGWRRRQRAGKVEAVGW